MYGMFGEYVEDDEEDSDEVVVEGEIVVVFE